MTADALKTALGVIEKDVKPEIMVEYTYFIKVNVNNFSPGETFTVIVRSIRV